MHVFQYKCQRWTANALAMLTMVDVNATSATPATINIQPALVNIIMNVLRIFMKLRWSILKYVLRTLFKSIRFCATKNFVQTKGCLPTIKDCACDRTGSVGRSCSESGVTLTFEHLHRNILLHYWEISFQVCTCKPGYEGEKCDKWDKTLEVDDIPSRLQRNW